MPGKKDEAKEVIRLNGREISREELQRQKEAAEKQKNVELKEVSPGEFKMRLKG